MRSTQLSAVGRPSHVLTASEQNHQQGNNQELMKRTNNERINQCIGSADPAFIEPPIEPKT
ncbi:hypothetical protein [Prochlorococcus marinus]|uniref:hypothetical protein n=1 Tax=Prochlorococcus marinus TaxID=1219 RepID=UPI0012FE8AC0|nr:hypothetical protein [Prochlorococcus marinus]